MAIKDKELKHWIDNYYGYGSWDARIWFIGYEEGGGDTPEEVGERLSYFHTHHPRTPQATALCDIRALYKNVTATIHGPKARLFTTLHDYRFGPNAVPHGVWKNLIAFVHGFRGKKLPDLLAYQKNSFALHSKASEALIPLYPLPSPHNHAWYYSWLDMPQFDFLKSRILYEDHVYQSRMHRILHNMSTHKPEVVVMYGMSNINELKKSVQEFFPSAKFKKANAIKLKIPQRHQAEFNGTTMVITTQIPALRHNRIETGFDWLEFGRTIRSGK